MKTTYKFILVALAATAALTACTKDLTTGKVDGNQPEGTLRTIAVSFSTPTKSYISGYNESDKEYNVRFSEGDKILVSDGKTTEECEVIPKPGELATTNPQMVIQTKLKGSLVAVYPSDAAKVEDDRITGIIVDDMQSGSFADANICTADQGGGMAKSNDALTFTTRVAILRFYADQSIGVSKIQINSEGPDICTEGTTITIDPAYKKPQSDQKEQAKKKAAAAAPASRFLYAAVDVSSTVTATALTIRSYAESQGEGYVEKTPTANVDLVYNKMYNVFMPYYIKVQVGTDEGDNPIYQKWGYCNVGAFLPEEPGLYFSWGNTEGHWLNGESDGYQFTEATYEETPGYGITEGPLPLANDAAYVTWGENWRMPTKEESGALRPKCEWDYYATDPGKQQYGLCCGRLFLPETGSISGETIYSKGNSSQFWTSDFASYGWAYRFDVDRALDDPSNMDNVHCGLPIRPIYDETLSDGGDPVSLTNNPYNNGGTF